MENRKLVPFDPTQRFLYHDVLVFPPEDETLIEGVDFFYRMTEFGLGPYFLDPTDRPNYDFLVIVKDGTAKDRAQVWSAGWRNIFLQRFPALERLAKKRVLDPEWDVRPR